MTTCRSGHSWEGKRDARGFRVCSACERARRPIEKRTRPTWNRMIGARAAEHPPVAPALLVDPPVRVSLPRLVTAAADVAFDTAYGYGAGGDASHGLMSLAGLLADVGCIPQEALAGLEREYAAGLKQGRAYRRRSRGGRS